MRLKNTTINPGSTQRLTEELNRFSNTNNQEMLNMKKYGIYNAIEDTQEVNNINNNEVIEFADVERRVNTGEIAEIRTLDQARELLNSLGYLVEEI